MTIGNSVTSIGSSAFNECKWLTSVHISDLAAWCKISFADNPLYYAHHLFLNGEEVKDLVIPNSVTSIGQSAFRDCSGLTSVTIPGSVTSIGGDAFESCSGLTSVTIPNSVTSIGSEAFWDCSGLTSVTIPNSVTSIGNSAFEDCSGLTSVTIGSRVKEIAMYAFASCNILETVTCLAVDAPYANYPFSNVNVEHTTLKVPTSSISSYARYGSSWNEFGAIEELGKCVTPTINFTACKITATSKTDGAVCHIAASSDSINVNGINSLSPNFQIKVTAYATAEGYEQSETATATFDLTNVGDMNGDGKFSIEDVTLLVNKILKK